MNHMAHRCPGCQSLLVAQTTHYLCVRPSCNTRVEMPIIADPVARTVADLELTEGEVRHVLAALRRVDRKASAKANKLAFPSHAKMLEGFTRKLTAYHQAMVGQKQLQVAEEDEPLDARTQRRQDIVGKLRRKEITEDEAQRRLAMLNETEEEG